MESLKDKFKYAFRGLYLGFKDKAIVLQCVIMCFAFLLAYLYKFTMYEWIITILCCVIVVSLEFINSIIEMIMDFIHPNYHDKVKDIKDMSAGLVLFACILIFIIGIILYGSKCIDLIHTLF